MSVFSRSAEILGLVGSARKHYGLGNEAVLTCLSRYVLRTAISNARILGMDQVHVTFRWKDRSVDAWHTEWVAVPRCHRVHQESSLPRALPIPRQAG